jgi:photosystem II stability/assembly factor-like uncharacterized protein
MAVLDTAIHAFLKQGVAVVLCLLATIPLAHADDSVAAALNHPAAITPRAAAGLVTSIARAGTRLVAVGEHGWILLSDDNGHTWRQAASPTSVTLTHVMFITPTTGWALGQMGAVLHTENAGQTWSKQLDGVTANNITLATAQSDIKTKGTNDTTTANLQSAEALAGGGPSVPFLNLLALSPSNLLLVGGFGLAMTSTDAGASWVSAADQLANPQGLHLYGLAEQSGTVFIAGEQGLLLKGPPGGPYNPVTTPFTGTYFGILATPAQLYLYGLQGTLLRSSDAGATWQTLPTNTGAGIDAAVPLQDGRILFGDVAGDLLLSSGAGAITATQAGEPVAALAQAADGAIIAGGPFGPRRIALSALPTK